MEQSRNRPRRPARRTPRSVLRSELKRQQSRADRRLALIDSPSLPVSAAAASPLAAPAPPLLSTPTLVNILATSYYLSLCFAWAHQNSILYHASLQSNVPALEASVDSAAQPPAASCCLQAQAAASGPHTLTPLVESTHAPSSDALRPRPGPKVGQDDLGILAVAAAAVNLKLDVGPQCPSSTPAKRPREEPSRTSVHASSKRARSLRSILNPGAGSAAPAKPTHDPQVISLCQGGESAVYALTPPMPINDCSRLIAKLWFDDSSAASDILINAHLLRRQARQYLPAPTQHDVSRFVRRSITVTLKSDIAALQPLLNDVLVQYSKLLETGPSKMKPLLHLKRNPSGSALCWQRLSLYQYYGGTLDGLIINSGSASGISRTSRLRETLFFHSDCTARRKQTCRFLLHCVDGLLFHHAQNVLLCDIKPSNMFYLNERTIATPVYGDYGHSVLMFPCAPTSRAQMLYSYHQVKGGAINGQHPPRHFGMDSPTAIGVGSDASERNRSLAQLQDYAPLVGLISSHGIGTRLYCAPETFPSSNHATLGVYAACSDGYSLAISLLQILAGKFGPSPPRPVTNEPRGACIVDGSYMTQFCRDVCGPLREASAATACSQSAFTRSPIARVPLPVLDALQAMLAHSMRARPSLAALRNVLLGFCT